MKKAIPYILSIVLPLSYACSNKSAQTAIIIEPRFAIPNTPVAGLIQQIRPQSQQFRIMAGAEQVLSGKGGTRIFVPRNSFVNADGSAVTGEVEIELIEVLSVADLVKTNLQTVSNGRPLQSEGMFYIDAKSGGKQVALAQGKELQVELPKMDNMPGNPDTRIFSGTYDSSGRINWTESGGMDSRLIPLPLELFNYKQYLSSNYERTPDNIGYTAAKSGYEDPEENLEPEEIVDSTSFHKKTLENTFITTREFEERFYSIHYAEWAIGMYTSYYTTTPKRGRIVKDSAISHLYLNNLDKDLWYCDSLAYAYFKSWIDRDGFKNHIYGESEPWEVLERFRKFYEKRAGKTYKFPGDIKFNSPSAREQLLAKGYDETETDRLLGAYKRQQEIITARRNQKTAVNIMFNSFAISKLGWINCDRFYDDPKARGSHIVASVSPGHYESAVLSLIINGRRMALGSMPFADSKYTFTGKKEPYTKLPIGEKATIVAISYKDKKPYLGIREIEISEKGDFNIELRESSLREIEEKLGAIR